MSVVLYINKLGDDSIAIIAAVRRYFDLSFFEVADMIEQSMPIELPPLDDSYVDAFIREMGEVQTNISRTAVLVSEPASEPEPEDVSGMFSFDDILEQAFALKLETPAPKPAAPKPVASTPKPAAPKPAAPKPATTAATTASGSDIYNVRIINGGNQKLAVVKYVKELLNCGLAEAKDQVDNNLICLKGTSQQAAQVVNDLRQYDCLAAVALAAASRPAKPSTPTIGAAKPAPKPTPSTVSLEITDVSGGAYKILGILTKAYGFSYSDAGKYLRNGAKLPPLPAAQAAEVANQLRALGCEVKG